MLRFAAAVAVFFMAVAFARAMAPEIKGQIKKLDLDKGTITLLEGPPKAPFENIYSLARADIPVTLPTGKLGKLADLKEGFKVGLQLLGDDVTAIRIVPLTLVAAFTRCDEKARTVAVRLAGSPAESVFPVQPDAPILLNNKKAAWADFKPGQKIQLVFGGDKTLVLQIQAGADIENVKETKAKLTRFTGILFDHDPGKNKARVIHVGVSAVQMKEYSFARDAEVKLFHARQVLRLIEFKDLGPLLKIHFFADMDTNTIVSLDAELPVVRRKIIALDVEKGKITIEEDKKNRTCDLAGKLQVFVNGKADKVDRVKFGVMTGIGFGLDRTQVEAIFLTKAEAKPAK